VNAEAQKQNVGWTVFSMEKYSVGTAYLGTSIIHRRLVLEQLINLEVGFSPTLL
jgi:hypothetical protein